MCLRDQPGATLRCTTLCRFACHNLQIMRNTPNSLQLDAIDRLILAELQSNGKLSNVELAQRVHLSPSACLRRVKQLEDEGVIAQYVALTRRS